MQRMSVGRRDAVAILYDRYHRLVFNVAVRIVRDRGEAEDVVQIVFLDFFRAMANFDSGKSILKVWILQYAYHRALTESGILFPITSILAVRLSPLSKARHSTDQSVLHRVGPKCYTR